MLLGIVACLHQREDRVAPGDDRDRNAVGRPGSLDEWDDGGHGVVRMERVQVVRVAAREPHGAIRRGRAVQWSRVPWCRDRRRIIQCRRGQGRHRRRGDDPKMRVVGGDRDGCIAPGNGRPPFHSAVPQKRDDPFRWCLRHCVQVGAGCGNRRVDRAGDAEVDRPRDVERLCVELGHRCRARDERKRVIGDRNALELVGRRISG